MSNLVLEAPSLVAAGIASGLIKLPTKTSLESSPPAKPRRRSTAHHHSPAPVTQTPHHGHPGAILPLRLVRGYLNCDICTAGPFRNQASLGVHKRLNHPGWNRHAMRRTPTTAEVLFDIEQQIRHALHTLEPAHAARAEAYRHALRIINQKRRGGHPAKKLK